MALGSNYDNNKKENKDFQPTVYSPYRMSNVEGVDPSALTFSFWANTMKVSIAPASTKGESVSFDYKNAGMAYLTHTKARILSEEISRFLENPDAYNNVGVDTKGGLISISSGKEFGVSSPCLVIRKIDETTGQVQACYIYEFKTKYHYSVRNFDEKTTKFDSVYYDTLEIEQFKTVLDEYYRAMNYAMAYTVVDASRFDNARTNNKIDAVAEKLGIQKYSKDGNSGNKSFFSGNSGGDKGFSSGTIDDIVSEMEDI